MRRVFGLAMVAAGLIGFLPAALPAAAAIVQKSHVAAKPDRKAARNHGHKRPMAHDATLDWPQLG